MINAFVEEDFMAHGDEDFTVHEDREPAPAADPAFDAKWWFENDGTRRVKAVVTTYCVGDVSVSTRVEFE